MVAVSPEIDDDDLRIREGLLDETLDFNSVHSHRDTLQVGCGCHASSKPTCKISAWASRLGCSHQDAGTGIEFAGFVAKRRANRCQVSDMPDAACWGCDLFADNLPSTSDFVGISCFPRAARLLLSR